MLLLFCCNWVLHTGSDIELCRNAIIGTHEINRNEVRIE